MMSRARTSVAAIVIVIATCALSAHSGPPFPIVTDAVRGPYMISIWTDPDATDDGSRGGQFWIVIAGSTEGATVPADTRANITVRPSTPRPPSPVEALTTRTAPVRGDATNQFGAVVMNHEGPYEVDVEVTGPLGLATVNAMVDATYDLRPPPYMLAWYLMPFLFVGFLWTRLLLRRRQLARKR